MLDKWFHSVCQGTAQLQVLNDKAVVSSRKAQSGQMLDFNGSNLFHDMDAFKNHQHSEVHARLHLSLCLDFPAIAWQTLPAIPTPR
jgi:hypothetical protein